MPHGETPDEIRNSPVLKGLNIPRTGRPGVIGVLTTKTLVIAGEGGVFTNAAGEKGALLRAYDKATGKDAGAVYMPSGQTGSPMTYMLNGRQYIVVAIGGPGYPGRITGLHPAAIADRDQKKTAGPSTSLRSGEKHFQGRSVASFCTPNQMFFAPSSKPSSQRRPVQRSGRRCWSRSASAGLTVFVCRARGSRVQSLMTNKIVIPTGASWWRDLQFPSDQPKTLLNQMLGVDKWVDVGVRLHRIIASIS